MPGRPSALPNNDDVNRVLSLSDFGDFNDELEDLHDLLHGWTGGTMGRVATAAFDPIFWSHHLHDRPYMVAVATPAWELWHTTRHARYGIQPFNFTVRSVLNIYKLGYDYASTQVFENIGR